MATNKSDVVTTIKRARKAAGLTQQEAADRSGVPLSTYQSYEQGKAMPPYERVQAILGALGEAVVQPEDITTDVRPTETPGEFYLVLSMNGQAFYRSACILPLRGAYGEGKWEPLLQGVIYNNGYTPHLQAAHQRTETIYEQPPGVPPGSAVLAYA